MSIRAKFEALAAKYHKCGNQPLTIATEVIAAVDAYTPEDAVETGYKDPNQYCRSVFGRGSGRAFWNRRACAILRLGPECARYLHHDVAVYVFNNVADMHLEEVKEALHAAFRKNGRVFLTKPQARLVVSRTIRRAELSVAAEE